MCHFIIQHHINILLTYANANIHNFCSSVSALRRKNTSAQCKYLSLPWPSADLSVWPSHLVTLTFIHDADLRLAAIRQLCGGVWGVGQFWIFLSSRMYIINTSLQFIIKNIWMIIRRRKKQHNCITIHNLWIHNNSICLVLKFNGG